MQWRECKNCTILGRSGMAQETRASISRCIRVYVVLNTVKRSKHYRRLGIPSILKRNHYWVIFPLEDFFLSKMKWFQRRKYVNEIRIHCIRYGIFLFIRIVSHSAQCFECTCKCISTNTKLNIIFLKNNFVHCNASSLSFSRQYA